MANKVRYIKKLIRDIYGHLTRPIHRIRFISEMKKKGFVVHFVNEGDTTIDLPKLTYLDALLRRELIDKARVFSGRINSEPLLRQIVYRLYEGGFASSSESIVDIGAWLSDNSIVWSTYLNADAYILAIDPSSKNLEFGDLLAKQNGMKNLNFIQAVCSDSVGESMRFSGDIEHTSFSKDKIKTADGILSSTLDEIIKERPIGLIHLDVEGHEFEVTAGAKETIQKYMPIIIFEQHLIEDNPQKMFDYLKNFNYSILMINEILPRSNLDCRNFFAYPEHFPIEDFHKHLSDVYLRPPIMPAVLGRPLLEI